MGLEFYSTFRGEGVPRLTNWHFCGKLGPWLLFCLLRRSIRLLVLLECLQQSQALALPAGRSSHPSPVLHATCLILPAGLTALESTDFGFKALLKLFGNFLNSFDVAENFRFVHLYLGYEGGKMEEKGGKGQC